MAEKRGRSSGNEEQLAKAPRNDEEGTVDQSTLEEDLDCSDSGSDTSGERSGGADIGTVHLMAHYLSHRIDGKGSLEGGSPIEGVVQEDGGQLNGEDQEQVEWTEVNHKVRKVRSQPIAVILRTAREEISLNKCNVNVLAEQIRKVCGAPILGSRYTRSGDLVVEVESTEMAERLIANTELCGHAIIAAYPGSHPARKGRIRNVDRYLSKEAIASALQAYNVTDVSRDHKQSRNSRGEIIPYPLMSVTLTFSTPEVPAQVVLGNYIYEVLPVVSLPP